MKAFILRVRYPIAILLALGVTLFSAEGSLRSKPPEKPKPTISVESFETEDVIGYLGHPLGTVVRVTGVAVDGKSIGSKYSQCKTYLRIETVNNKELKKPVDFEFKDFEGEIEKPLPEQRFDYYVHEHGSFQGIANRPKGLERGTFSEAYVGVAFHYQRFVTVHRSQPVK